MPQSRMTLLDLLKQQLDPDLEKKQSILNASKDFWRSKDLASRSFDTFQYLKLMDPDYFSELSEEYVSFLDIKSINLSDYSLTSKTDQDKIKKWEQKIIQYACDNLLKKDGSLNKALLEYLEWNNYDVCYNPKDIEDIVCSYVGIVGQHFILDNKEKAGTDAYHAVQFYINRNYGDWVHNEIQENYSRTVETILDVNPDSSVKLSLKVKGEVVEKKEIPKTELEVKKDAIDVPEKILPLVEIVLDVKKDLEIEVLLKVDDIPVVPDIPSDLIVIEPLNPPDLNAENLVEEEGFLKVPEYFKISPNNKTLATSHFTMFSSDASPVVVQAPIDQSENRSILEI